MQVDTLPNSNNTIPRMSPGQLGQSSSHGMGSREPGVSEGKRMLPASRLAAPEPKVQSDKPAEDSWLRWTRKSLMRKWPQPHFVEQPSVTLSSTTGGSRTEGETAGQR